MVLFSSSLQSFGSAATVDWRKKKTTLSTTVMCEMSQNEIVTYGRLECEPQPYTDI